MHLPELVLASANQGKLCEFRRLLKNTVGRPILQTELGIESAPEPHCTFVENALAKARAACVASDLPSLADDSGICVSALQGGPGIQSARYTDRGDDANNQLLLERLGDTQQRGAHYHCTLVLCRHAQDPCPLIAEGRWYGTIAQQPRGTNGFGYDPIFVTSNGCTAAELEPAIKDKASHRGMAVTKLRELLNEEYL